MTDTTNDDARQTNIPAQGETDLDDIDAVPADEGRNDSERDRIYQDDLDYRNDDTDPIIMEENDDPTKELGVPAQELKDELDKYVIGSDGSGDDDMREAIEDRDEDDDNAASSSQ